MNVLKTRYSLFSVGLNIVSPFTFKLRNENSLNRSLPVSILFWVVSNFEYSACAAGTFDISADSFYLSIKDEF
jgi:hypothetical protein